MRKIFLLTTLLFLLTFLGTIALAQKAILQTDCGKIDCGKKSPSSDRTYAPGNWTDAGAECICQYYTPEEWKLTYCGGAGPPTEEELQIWRDCGVPVPGGPLSGSWGWKAPGAIEPTYETIESVDLTQLTFLYTAYDPDWSPDGSQIAFTGRKSETEIPGLYLINADGTGLEKIGPGDNLSWSPVDNRIIYRGEEPWQNLFLVDLDKGWESKVKLVNQICQQGSWSPDGTKIVYSARHNSTSFALIWIMNSDGSGKTRLTTDEDGYCMASSFSYDGSKIVYVKGFMSGAIGGPEEEPEPNEIWVMDADGSNKHMIYAPGDSPQWVFQRAWNKNNKILFMKAYWSQKFPQIWIINSDGSDPKPIVSDSEVFGDAVWDNTGTKVAISRTIPSTGLMRSNVWTFSYEEPAEEELVSEIEEEEEEVIEEPEEEEVEEASKNILQKIWEKISNFFEKISNLFKRIFRII